MILIFSCRSNQRYQAVAGLAFTKSDAKQEIGHTCILLILTGYHQPTVLSALEEFLLAGVSHQGVVNPAEPEIIIIPRSENRLVQIDAGRDGVEG